jgi:hypothetical protein
MDIGSFLYKTIAIYPAFADVGNALALLKNEGFTEGQISLLGREQDHWQERLNVKWEALHTAKGALEGAALGAIPGLVLVAGIALSGGAGVLAVGPLVAALEALGMGALGGSVVGGATFSLDSGEREVNVEEEVEDAIGRGKWVIVTHCHDEAEALRAQSLLPDSRVVQETGLGAKPH